jgi:GNAT superfamily N-acetyltransferase
MPEPIPGTDVADLAPGDARAAGYDWSGKKVHRIRSSGHAWFERAYARLWREFGEHAEMEERSVIEGRLRWRPSEPIAGHALLYELIAVESDGELIAVRDHTAILRLDPPGAAPAVVVHLSHAWVDPRHRRSGLAAWLRALPLAAARDCAALAGTGLPRSIDLVAEMEPPSPAHPARSSRLLAYERAGFRMIDPSSVAYLQPDFRPAAEIDASALAPLPFVLIVRRVGAEAEETLPSSRVRAIVGALYRMYQQHLRADDMRELWRRLDEMVDGDEPVRLVRPTSVGPEAMP